MATVGYCVETDDGSLTACGRDDCRAQADAKGLPMAMTQEDFTDIARASGEPVICDMCHGVISLVPPDDDQGATFRGGRRGGKSRER